MSFFGFDTTLPAGRKARHNTQPGSVISGGLEDEYDSKNDDTFGLTDDGGLEVDYSRIDELLEKKFAYGGLELGDDDDGEYESGSKPKQKISLEDDDEDLNDETFGDIGGDVGIDFDFTGGAGGNVSAANTGVKEEETHAPPAVHIKPPADWAHPKAAHQPADPVAQIWGSPSRSPVAMNLAGAQFNSQKVNQRPIKSLDEVEAELRAAQIQSGLEKPAFNQQQSFSNPRSASAMQQILRSEQDGRQNEIRPQYSPQSSSAQFMPLHELDRQIQNQPPPPDMLFALQRYHQQQQLQQQMSMGGPPRPGGFGQGLPMGHGPMPPPPGMMMGGPMNDGRPPGPGGMMPPGMMMPRPMDYASGGPERPPFPNQMNQQIPANRGQGGTRGRQEYGQLRYNDRAMSHQSRIIPGSPEPPKFQIPRGYKGPPPLSGGWGGRRDVLPRWERYADSMTQYEKETIAKIQISQLVTDEPFIDDFYYQIFVSLRKKAAEAALGNAGASVGNDDAKNLTWQQSLLVSNTGAADKGSSNKMQLQMQKLIEGRKQKPKGTSLALEGALGKISLNSVRNPRQLIQIQSNAQKLTAHAVPQISRLTSRKVLKSIENVYSYVLSIEHLKRKGPDTEDPDDLENWKANIVEYTASIWSEMSLAEPVPFTAPHPFTAFLSYAKGKRVIPRIIRLLSPEQILAMTTTLLARAESLDVCNMPAGTANEQVDLFISNVIPSIVVFVSEVPMHVVNACTRILLERHNMVWLAKSRVGLTLLTIFLSRAEILKQGGGAAQGIQPPSPEDLSLWTDLYNFLFASLHTHFSSIFPTSTEGDASAQATSDEVFVWQFLAAMAVGATTLDHQRVLVTEVRSNVIETSRRGQRASEVDKDGVPVSGLDPAVRALQIKALANVNLFLNALGLGIDASTLAAMG